MGKMTDSFRKPDQDKQSYGRILKASSIMGGVAVITMLLSFARTKLAAVLLGSVGVGLLATLGHLQGLLVAVSGMGLQSSAVKQIAELNTDGKQLNLARNILMCRRVALLGGLAGAAIIASLAPTLSFITFDTNRYSADIAMLGIAVFFLALHGANLAILQGTSNIRYLANTNLSGSFYGTLMAGSSLVFLEMDGVAPALVLMAGAQLACSQYYVAKIRIEIVNLTWIDSLKLAKPVLQMGLAFVWSALFANLVNYLCVILITQSLSLGVTGVYSAALVLSGVFIGFVLGAMAADFYPRLSAVSSYPEEMIRLINQQAEIGILLSLPGLVATVVYAHWAVLILYSSEMIGAANLLPIFVLGCFGRVLSWPLGFVLLALGKKWHFALSETLFNLLLLLLTWLFLINYALTGVAIAFLLSYCCYFLGIWALIRKLIGFRFSVSTIQLTLWSIAVLLFSVGLTHVFTPKGMLLYGSLIVLLTAGWCLRELSGRLEEHHRLLILLRRFPLVSRILKKRLG